MLFHFPNDFMIELFMPNELGWQSMSIYLRHKFEM